MASLVTVGVDGLLIVVLCFLPFPVIVTGQSAWNQNTFYEPGKYNDVCDSTRPCNPARNLVCSPGTPFGVGRCLCKVQMFGNQPWIYNQILGICQDPNTPNLNPHHHYNPNQPPNQPPPQNPFGSGRDQQPVYGGNGNNNGGGYPGGGNNGNGNGGNGGGTEFGGRSGVGLSCQDDRVCIVALGDYSRCAYSRCICFDTQRQGKGQVAEYQGRCWPVARENEECNDDEQCILGARTTGVDGRTRSERELKCIPDPNASDETVPMKYRRKRCYCQGIGCHKSSGTALGSQSALVVTILGLGFIFRVIGANIAL